MNRLPFTRFDQNAGGWPRCWVLVPQTDAERSEVREAFAKAGVSNSLAFSKKEINGRLDFPHNLTWEPDGAVQVSITVQGQTPPLAAWFWLVECDDGSGRRFAWWSMQHDQDRAETWS